MGKENQFEIRGARNNKIIGIIERYLNKEVKQEEWNKKIMGVAKRYLNKEVEQEEWSMLNKRSRASRAEEQNNRLSKRS